MMKNQLLAQAEANIEKSVPADQQNAYARIMVAGMKVLFSQQTHGVMVEKLQESEDPLSDTGKGAVGLIMTLDKESKGTMRQNQPRAMAAAGAALMLNALDYLDSAGIVKIDKPEIDRATEIFLDALMPNMGLTSEKTQALMGKVQGVMADPEKMKQYKGA
jgi:hypothetical protein